MTDLSRLRITIYRTPPDAAGPPWCWNTEDGHGQAASPNECAVAALRATAKRLSQQHANTMEHAAAYQREWAAHIEAAAALVPLAPLVPVPHPSPNEVLASYFPPAVG
jgi:hypothetical protein